MTTRDRDQITAIQVNLLQLPMPRPVAFSTRRLSHREFVLVRIATADGLEGIGYTYGGSVVARAISSELAPVLIGQPSGAIERLWRAMYQESLLSGRRGALLRAISAVDIGLWDILGKRAGLPLFRLLGYNDSSVRAYFSGGYYADDWTIESLAAEAERAVAGGFDSMKMKIGRLPLEGDLERIAAVRSVLGPTRRLALDANNAWPDWSTALGAIKSMQVYNPWWVEEPLSPDDVEGHAQLVDRLDTTIATGEIEATRWGFARLIDARASTLLQPDACVIGGVSEWLKVAHLAAAHNIQIAPHWNADVHVHLAAAVANCVAVEFFDVNEGVYNFDLILNEHLTPVRGHVTAPERPGVGLVLNPGAVERFTVEETRR